MVYFLPYLILLVSGLGIYFGGMLAWLGFAIFFVIYPFLEFLLRNKKLNPAISNKKLSEVSLFLLPLFLTGFLILALFRAASGFGLEWLSVTLSAGSVVGALAITSGHELVHRKNRLQRALGVYNLMLVNFAHFGLEHVLGHHKYVATPLDPATARANESVYVFWFRNYFGGIKGAIKISPVKVLSYALVTAFSSAAIYLIFGLASLISWWVLSVIAVLLLQTVDYIEHYGLLRSKNADGFYMAFKAQHSWDTESFLTNWTLFNLGLHSHHHMKASLPFQNLVKNESANVMPFGYSVMILLALIPPLYIRRMNSLIKINAAQ